MSPGILPGDICLLELEKRMTEAMYLIAQGGIQISETGTDSSDVPLRNMNCVMWRMLDNCLKPRSVQTRWRLKKFRISPERFFDI